jgi:hypothetical protein
MRMGWIGIVWVLAMASPAGAQIWDGGRSATPDPRLIDVQIAEGSVARTLRDDIRTARRSGQITRQEARSYRRQAAAIEAAEERYRANGLSDGERAELTARSHAVRSLLTAGGNP